MAAASELLGCDIRFQVVLDHSCLNEESDCVGIAFSFSELTELNICRSGHTASATRGQFHAETMST